MEIPSSIIVAGVAFIILIILFIYTLAGGTIPFISVSGVINGNPSDNEYSPISQWSSPTNLAYSTCKGYKFPVDTAENYNINTISLGTPSLNRLNNSCSDNSGVTSCENGILVYDTPYYCIDEDQINAIKQSHSCNRVVIDNVNNYDYPTSSVLCTKMDGTQAKYGETEEFYSYCTAASAVRYCSGSVGTINIGFSQSVNCKVNGQNSNFNCLQNDRSPDNILSAGPCNLSDDLDPSTQQFRIILDKTSEQIVTSSKSGTGVEGNKMRIEDRESCDQYGNNCKCVYPINPSGTGEGLILDDCNKGDNDIFQGFVWGIIPATKFPESVFCKNQYAGDSSAIDNCLKSINEDTYNSCVSSCKTQCVNQNTNCLNGCPPGGNSKINCADGPSGSTEDDYTNCFNNTDSETCTGTCVSNVCSNQRDCYANCQTILNGEGPNIYSKSSYTAQQQIIYIGNGLSYTDPIPTKSPTDLYNYIITNKCKSIKQNIDNSGKPSFTMENYSIGQKMSYNNSDNQPTCGLFSPCAVNASCADYLTTDYSGIIMNFPLYNTFSKVISAGCDCGSKTCSSINCITY